MYLKLCGNKVFVCTKLELITWCANNVAIKYSEELYFYPESELKCLIPTISTWQ